jgi:hypothetical protein
VHAVLSGCPGSTSTHVRAYIQQKKARHAYVSERLACLRRLQPVLVQCIRKGSNILIALLLLVEPVLYDSTLSSC